MDAKIIDGLSYACGFVLIVVATLVPARAADWLYDGESRVVWWIVFLFLWPLIGGAIYGAGMLPFALLAMWLREK